MGVNGWSFVKGDCRYYDKVARQLRKSMLASPHGKLAMQLSSEIKPPPGLFHDMENNNILRSVVAVFRHADRTPKQNKTKQNNKPTNQQTNKPANQPTNQPTNQNKTKQNKTK